MAVHVGRQLESALPGMVRAQGQARLPAPLLAAGRRLSGERLFRQAGDRDLQFLVRADELQRALAPGRRSSQARGLVGGRVSAGVPDDLARRAVHAAFEHDVSQLDGDGRGGVDPRQSDGRRRPALRLRQDDAGTAHGGGQRGPAVDLRHRGADAQGHLEEQGNRLGHRRLALLGRVAGRTHQRGGLVRDGVLHVAFHRSLHGDGHRLDDDEPDRGPGHDADGLRQHPGGGFAPLRDRPPERGAHRRDGARGSEALAHPDPRSLGERGARRHGDRRVDERDHSPDGAGRALGDRLPPGAVRRAFARDGGGGEHPALRQAPHGGHVLRRRHSRGHERPDRPAARRHSDRHGQDSARERPRRGMPQPGGHPAAGAGAAARRRDDHPEGQPLPPTGRFSRPAPPLRSCCSTAAGPSSSKTTRI